MSDPILSHLDLRNNIEICNHSNYMQRSTHKVSTNVGGRIIIIMIVIIMFVYRAQNIMIKMLYRLELMNCLYYW